MSDFEPFFSWAHLSDIHMGHGDAGHSWNQRIVLAALKEDIQRATNGYELTLSAIFVTGDLAFSGNVRSSDEYQRVGDWLRQVAASVSISSDSIFVIPGNHDVQRNVEVDDENVDCLLKSLRCGDKLLDNALNDHAEQAMLTARMRNYLNFAKEFAPSKTDASSTEPQLFWTHYLDADVGLRIRLAGLNTALLCAKEEDEYGDYWKLQVGQQQLARAFTETQIIQGREVVITLSHHPLDWLRDRGRLSRAVTRYADIHLCGHTHEAQSSRTRSGTGTDLIHIVSGAAHGESALADATDSHGYSLGSLGIRGDGRVVLRIWPRIWSRNHDFRPDHDSLPKNDDEGRPYQIHYVDHELSLRLSRYQQPVRTIPGRDEGSLSVEGIRSIEAQRRLAMLPVDVVPEPSTLPPGSVMTLNYNPRFVGRSEELKVLATKLKANPVAGSGSVVIAAATGLGGVGKTQLASEFAHRYGRYFDGGVFWLSFAERNNIPAEIAACGGAGRMDLRPDFDRLSLENQVQAVRSAWQSPLPRLLIFDNCESEELLEQWRPSTGGCRVLVTSRREQWDTMFGVETLPLDVLRREESVALLRKHRRDLTEDDPDLDGVAQKLGDLPLALDLAGRFLKRYRFAITPARYLEELHRPSLLEHRSLQDGDRSPTGHEQHVERTFALSYQRLDPTDSIDARARALLARAARFAPGEPIDYALLVSALGSTDDNGEAALQTEDALNRLGELGLLEQEREAAYTMHRLVASFVLREIDDEKAQRDVERAVGDAALRIVQQGQPVKLGAIMPHLRYVTGASGEREDYPAGLARYAMGVSLYSLGSYDEARPYLEHGVRISTSLRGAVHRRTLRIRNDLAVVMKRQGDRDGALGVYEEVLEDQKRELGPRHHDVASTLLNIGSLLRENGLYHEVLPRYQEALDIREEALAKIDPDDPERRQLLSDVAECLHNIGAAFMDLGRHRKAAPYFERALRIYERVLNDVTHYWYAGTAMTLGSALRAQKNYREARDRLEQALEVHRQILPEGHGSIAKNLMSLGTLLEEQANLDESLSDDEQEEAPISARGHLDEALTLSEELYGRRHPLQLWQR